MSSARLCRCDTTSSCACVIAMALKLCSWISRSSAVQCLLTFENCYGSGAKVLTVHQQTRGRRRGRNPPSWFFPREAGPEDVNEDLTPENEKFVWEEVQQYFPPRDPNSFLKDEHAQWVPGTWDKKTQRAGLLCLKLGAVPQWTKTGQKILCTLLQVVDNHVIKYIPPELYQNTAGCHPAWHGKFGSVVVGAMTSPDPFKFSKEYSEYCLRAGFAPKERLTRFLVTPNAAVQPGVPLLVNHFRVGDYVDVQAKTIDYGFQGVVKRWGMKGLPASHGVTKSHRKMGSTGGGKKHGIWKGKKMPGHMGDDWRAIRGLKIWRINTKYQVLYVQGLTPGAVHSWSRVMDTRLRYRRDLLTDNPPAMPTWVEGEEEQPEDIFHPDLHPMSDPTIVFQEVHDPDPLKKKAKTAKK